MKITIKQGKAHVQLKGDLSVADAADLKNFLVDSLARADAIVINLDRVTSIDLACLQLFCSTHRSAAKNGKKFMIQEPVPEPFIKARKAAGFMFNKQFATEDCLWIGGDSQ